MAAVNPNFGYRVDNMRAIDLLLVSGVPIGWPVVAVLVAISVIVISVVVVAVVVLSCLSLV